MDKNFLIESAGRLANVSFQTADEYHRERDQLIALMNGEMLKRPDVESLVGQNNIDMMKDNHANHVRFIASILKYPNPEVLVETILWVFRAYRSHGFTTNYWAAQLNTWIGVLKEVLSNECYNEVYPYYEWMQTTIPLFVKISGEEM